MAVYADYDFYTGTFKGTAIATESEFTRLAIQATAEIDAQTLGRAAPVVEADTDADTIAAIQMAMCAVAEELQTQEQGGQIQSERVGQHSVTYNVRSALSDEARIAKAAKRWLWATDLMYRGLDAD